MTPDKKCAGGGDGPRLFVDEGLLRSMVETMVETVLQEEVERYLGVGRYERSEGRRGYRNGSKPRTMRTAVGELQLQVPQVRDGGFRTQVFERYQRSDKALVAAMQEMVVRGVSTRNVSDVLEKLGGFEVSAATVSQAMMKLDEDIKEFLGRDLSGRSYPYMVVDARYEKVRKGGRVASQAVLIVAGIGEDGRRELLGFSTGDSESKDTWGELFAGLKKRGLKGVELVVSDAHQGIRGAVDKHFQGAAWQRCKVHLMREMLRKVPWKDYKELSGDLGSIYASAEKDQCLRVAQEVADKWQQRAPRMSKALREGVEDTLTVWSLPPGRRRKLNSTNMLERLMKEIKKRSRNVGSFPNEQSCVRLIGAILLEVQEHWENEPNRYLNMDDNPC